MTRTFAFIYDCGPTDPEGTSAQRVAACREAAEAESWRFGGTYVDRGDVSGIHGSTRPQWVRMIATVLHDRRGTEGLDVVVIAATPASLSADDTTHAGMLVQLSLAGARLVCLEDQAACAAT